MQRIIGRYSVKGRPIEQLDRQIEPQHWVHVEGYKFPIRGPFTQAICSRGIAVLYVSQPGEVPLFYSLTPGWVHWHEQLLALPGTAKRVNQGEAVIWSPSGCKTVKVEEIPVPSIVAPPSIEEAVTQYLDRIKQAVQRRVGDRQRVAVAQSGGVDSLLVTWALTQIGAEVVPLTVCTSLTDYDISVTTAVLPQMGVSAPVPVIVEQSQLEQLIGEAALCFESPEIGNLKMAIGNILMARKCQELGLDLIFNGHAQDDLHGALGFTIGRFKQLIDGTPSERWRDARHKEVREATGMVKMFSTCFRRYGVEVRMPYYDADLLEWALSQHVKILPVHHAKPFVRIVACSVLPPGPWQSTKYHSTGYITGAGFYEDLLRDRVEELLKTARKVLGNYRAMGWKEISQMHIL